MASVRVKVEVDEDAGAFLAALPAAMDEWRLESYHYPEEVADKVVDTARGLVAKRTGLLESTIHRDPLVITAGGAWARVVAGEGTRYVIYQEFGTSKMNAHPFMRPALAMAAGVFRGGAYAARTALTSQERAALKRRAHRLTKRRSKKK